MPTRPAQGSLSPSTHLWETESHQEMEGDPRNGSQVMGTTTAELLLGPIPACCMLNCSVIPILFRPHRLYTTRLLCPLDVPGENTGVGCHFLLQGIFPNQGLNPDLLHWQARFFTTEPLAKPIPFLFPCNKEPFSSQLNSTGPLLFAKNKTALVK